MRKVPRVSSRRLHPLSVSLSRLGSFLGIAAALSAGSANASDLAWDPVAGPLDVSAGAPAPAAEPGVPGINAYYYNFSNNPGTGSGLFASALLQGAPYSFTRTDAMVNVPQAGGSGTFPLVPVSGFGTALAGGVNDGAMWKGLLTINAAGTYQFSGTNDDNAVLYIDGVQIGTLAVVSAVTNIGTPITLTQGAHTIVYKFTQGTGGGYTTLRYNGTDTGNATVLVGSVADTLTTGSLAPTNIGGVTLTGNTTLDLPTDREATSITFNGSQTLTVTSPTISNLYVTGPVSLSGGTATLNSTTGATYVNAGIIETAPSALTLSGSYLTVFNFANSYTGITTVTAGELDLNATGGNSIPGNLLINAPTTAGLISNVKLLSGDQIADTSSVTVTSGVLNLGAFSDTIGTLTVNGGVVVGTGTLSAGTLDLQSGTVAVPLSSTSGINKSAGGTLILAANSSYTGANAVNAGTLVARGAGALGAGGAGNETSVASSAVLSLQGANVPAENIVIAGSGPLTGPGGVAEGTLRSSGTSTIANLTTTAPSTISVDAGQLILNGALDVTGGALTKTGNGTLTFASNQATIPAVTVLAGALGFSGPQSFGPVTLPAGATYRFNTDPTAGVNLTAPTGTTIVAGYALDQNLVSRVNAASTGTLALGVDSSANLNFSSVPNLSLGAAGLRTYSGTLTPGAAGYRLGGGGGELNMTSSLTGSTPVTVSGSGSVYLAGVQTFSGAVTVDGANARLRVLNHEQLGTNNVVTLTNGGTLQLIGTFGATNQTFHQLGNAITGTAKAIQVGTGGGRITLSNFANGATVYALTALDPISGAGNLIKDGFGNLMVMNPASITGSLTIAAQGNTVELRNAGAFANVASIDIGQSANLVVDNNNGFGTRQYASPNNNNRISDTAPIAIRGGQLLYRSKGTAGQTTETFGTVSFPEGHSIVRIEKNGTVGSDVTLAGLARAVGGGTVRFENVAGAFGAAGDNHRMVITGLTTTNNIGAWSFINNNGTFTYAAYDTAAGVGLKNATLTAQGAATWTPTNTAIYDLNAAGTATLADSATNIIDLDALRFSNNAAQTLAFTDGNDKLFIGSGGILDSNLNQTRAIGSATARGTLTAGTSIAAAGAKELFFHINQNTTTIESNISDNNGAVTLVKDLGGTIQINSGANTYTGGTNIWGGRINVVAAGGLGTGNVVIRGGVLEIRAPGTVSATATITAKEQSEIYLPTAANYNGAGDRFVVETGSTFTGLSNAAGTSLASITRVNTLTGPGQVVLQPGATVRSTSMTAGDIMQNMPANLGTAADLYFNTSAQGSQNQFINIGAGTPWKGISSSVAGVGWFNGTINANSDFYLEGVNRLGANVVLTLGAQQGATGQIGSYSIVNTSGQAINAFVAGQVAMNEDTTVSMPGDLTFVVTPGGYLQPNFTNSFGTGANTAKVLVQAGGTLDPGNYTTVGTAASQAQGKPYPLPSPANAQVTFEAGGRFLINDGSGIGTTAPGNWTMKTNSILQLGGTQAFLGGNANGLISPGQFAYENGVIVRFQVDTIYKVNDFVFGAMLDKKPVYELFDNNRGITDAINPTIVAGSGVSQFEAMDLIVGNGGMFTNDSADRQFNERRGALVLNDGAILAGTLQTYLNVQENIRVAPNATLTIGDPRTVDGLTKLGGVQLNGPNSNVIPASATTNVVSGAQLVFGAVNVWSDSATLNLPAAVTSFPAPGALALQPANGSSLLLNVANFMEHIGPLTGNGAVIANTTNTALATGRGATADWTSNVVFKNTNGQNPSLVKSGPTKMTLTSVSDSTGDIVVQEGELVISGTGVVDFNQARPQEGAKLKIDNSGAALNNRLGNPAFLIPTGGAFELVGHATTPVSEAIGALASGAGNFINVAQNGQLTTVTINPGAATTTLAVGVLENFQNAGQRTGTWVIRTPSMANRPGTSAVDTVYSINPTNTTNGLVTVTTPNLISNGANFSVAGGGTILGSPGSFVAPSRPDILWDTNLTGDGQGFVTVDGVLRAATIISGQSTMTVNNADHFTVGQTVAGGVIPAGTTVTAISGNVLTLSAAATGTAGTVNALLFNIADPAYNTIRPLAASEYAPYLRDNQSVSLNTKLTGTTTISGDTRVQTLTLTPNSTLNIAGTLPLGVTGSRLHLNGGGVFVQAGGTSSITGTANTFLQANTNAGLFLHTRGNLNVSTTLMSDLGVIKTGEGTLNLSPGTMNVFRGTLQIDGGTVNFAAGNNSFANVRAQNAFSGPNLYLNGGTLNLNGNSEMINLLNNSNELPGMGGTITSNANALLTVISGGRFSGSIDGSISLYKPGNNTLLLTHDNPYSGSTKISAGTLVLRDSGKIGTTSAVDVNYGTLQFDNGYLSNVVNRVNPAAPITLRGATINVTGAAAQVASQTFNSLTLAEGFNNFTSNAGGGGANEIFIGNLQRTLSSGATLNIQQNYGFVGTAGNTTTAIRDFITNVNGSAITLKNGLIGPWAVVNGDAYANYNSVTGVGAYGNVNDGFNPYESTDATTAAATANVNDGTARTFTVSRTINSWRIAPNAAVAMTFNSGVGLTLDSGGLLLNNNNTTSLNAATGASGNFITSNSGEFVTFVNQNTGGINIPITGDINFVKSGNGGLNIRPESTYNGTVTSGSNSVAMTATTGLVVGQPVSGTGIPANTTITAVTPTSITLSNNANAAATSLVVGFGNTYTGTTFVHGANGGGANTVTQLNMGAAAPGFVAIPGNLVIDNTWVTEANVPNQIKATANVTIGGGGRLNLVALDNVTETLGSLTFLDGAGATATANGLDRATARPTSTINLSGATAITATNTNPTTGVPFIGSFTGLLGFTNPTGSTLNIDSPVAATGLAAVGLRIDATITGIPTGVANGGLIKSGPGLLVLNPQAVLTPGSTFTATTTNATAVLSGIPSTVGLSIGQPVSGTGIPAGAFITNIIDGTSVRINANATASATVTVTQAGIGLNRFGNPSGYDGNLGSLIDVFNIQQGLVRFDTGAALGSNTANTVVQNGAVLLGSNVANQFLTGSVRLNGGSTLAATINSFNVGVPTSVVGNQSVLNVTAGSASIAAYDYYVPGTNNGNVTIHGRLTGSGTINLVGPQITQGPGAGGVILLTNPITTGLGANDFAGLIRVGANAILQTQQYLLGTTASSTGNELGTATIELSGGRLRLRDDFSTDNSNVSNQTATYGNNVVLTADSYLDANRSVGTGVNNTIALGKLTVASGTKVLNVDSTNGYVIRFSQLEGAGTLIKGGTGLVTIDDYAPDYLGSLGIAGPQGIAVAPSFNTTTSGNIVFTPTVNTFQTMAVNGFYIMPPSKVFTVPGEFSVGANPGNVSGMLAVPSSTVVDTSIFRNEGQVGAINGQATITANSGFTGSGVYLTRAQPLALAGNFVSGTMKVAGDNIVSLNGTTHGFTNGVEVQSGTLQLSPTGTATSSGTIRVLGSPSSTASATAAPIDAVNGTMAFDAVSGAITHTGNITNSGTVRVSNGTTTVVGSIAGPTVAYVPGLLEGYTTAPGGALPVTTSRIPNPGNFGIRLEPRMLQTNAVTQQVLTGHTDNDTWIYTGYVKDDDGVFSFAENIDDRAAVWIDGTLVLNAVNGGTSRVVSTAYSVGQQGTVALPGANTGTPSQNFGPGVTLPGYGDGWHLVEIRMNNGGGGSGPIAANGFAVNYGFGYKNGIAALDGADMIKPIDNGTGNLFVTPINAKGRIQLDSGGTLNVASVQATERITFNGPDGRLNLTGTGTASSSDRVEVLNFGNLNITANSSLTVGEVALGTNVLVVNNSLTPLNGVAPTGRLNVTGAGTGTGTLDFGGGILNVTGSISGSVTLGDGVLAGNSVDATTGLIAGAADLLAGEVSPGLNQPGMLRFGGGINFNGAGYHVDINGLTPGTGYDQLNVVGQVGLSSSAELTLSVGFQPAIGNKFIIVLNDEAFDPVAAASYFTSGADVLVEGDRIFASPFHQFSISYQGGDGNDVELTYVVPEPGALTLLLGGLATMCARRRRKS